MALFSVPAKAENLAEALEKAYAENPSLSAQRARTRAADELKTQANAAYGPSIDATGNYIYTRQSSNGLFGGINEGGATDYTVTLNQPFFTFGRLAAGQNIARAQRLAERESLRLAEQTLIAETVLVYVGVQRDLALYGARLQIAALLDEQFEITKRRFELRASTVTDVEQVDNQRQIARALAEEALATLEASANEYRRIVGKYPGELEPLPTTPILPQLEELLRIADQTSPQIGVAAFSENAARQLVALRRAERMPTVSGIAGARRIPATPFDDSRRALQGFAGISITMPVYRGGALGSRIREASELAQAARFDREEVRRGVRSDASSNWAQAQAARRVAPIYQEAVQSGQEALLNARRQETAGLRTSREIIDITNDLLNARINAINAAANGYTASVLTLFEAGLLDPAMFSARVEPYDPDGYDPFFAGFAGLPLRPVLAPIDRIFVEDRLDDIVIYYENAYGWEVPQPPVVDTADEALTGENKDTEYPDIFPTPRFVPNAESQASGSDSLD
ncbi:MAG: TolC family protein [Pseudomonadota bacterium]